MPPAGAPRPDQATLVSVASSLESALDRAEATRPHLGTLPLVHRLSRTEYENAVRDLLALGALPKEVSVDFLLPADNISSGFDNIADLLFISPSTMERYLDAARKISRVAVGDPAMPVLVNIHKLDPEHPQDERVDDLAFGTRGGLAVRSEFPVDGTYIIDIELAGAARDQQLEITIDGARVALRDLGANTPAGRGGGGRGRGGAAAEPLEFPIPLKAGPKLVGVSFVQRSEARDEATLRPRMRSRGTQGAIASVIERQSLVASYCALRGAVFSLICPPARPRLVEAPTLVEVPEPPRGEGLETTPSAREATGWSSLSRPLNRRAGGDRVVEPCRDHPTGHAEATGWSSLSRPPTRRAGGDRVVEPVETTRPSRARRPTGWSSLSRPGEPIFGNAAIPVVEPVETSRRAARPPGGRACRDVAGLPEATRWSSLSRPPRRVEPVATRSVEPVETAAVELLNE